MPNDEDLKVQLAEARTDTRIERVMGEMHAEFVKINARFDTIEKTTSVIKTTVITTGDVIRAEIAESAQPHPPAK